MGTAFSLVGSAIVGMLSSLISERFIKFAVIKGLEVLVKKTKTKTDDQLLEQAKKEWNNA
jgi:hypothetical protein